MNFILNFRAGDLALLRGSARNHEVYDRARLDALRDFEGRHPGLIIVHDTMGPQSGHIATAHVTDLGKQVLADYSGPDRVGPGTHQHRPSGRFGRTRATSDPGPRTADPAAPKGGR